jgi:hypothetical protein
MCYNSEVAGSYNTGYSKTYTCMCSLIGCIIHLVVMHVGLLNAFFKESSVSETTWVSKMKMILKRHFKIEYYMVNDHIYSLIFT